MMLETLFAHQQQEQVFLLMLACGMVLGLMLHIGTLLRRRLLSALWDALTAFTGAAMVLLVILRYQSGLHAYGVLGLLLGGLLYLAGPAQLARGAGELLQKYKNSRRPKAGDSAPGDESVLHKDEKR